MMWSDKRKAKWGKWRIPEQTLFIVTALGGGIGGAGYLIGDSVIDLFRKGQEVTFVKGTKFQTKLTQPIDIPVN